MTTVESIGAVIDLLVLKGAQQSDFLGCGEREIAQIRVAQGVAVLPPVYEEFLKVMGRGAGKFLAGTDIFYPHPVELKSAARDLLHENGVEDFLDHADVVFSMHQGYQFTWLSRDDPRVHMYSEGHLGVRGEWANLPAFLAAAI